MEDTKIKEMEEEIKVLKAQIHGVLLDIRETILERTNPLETGGETASIRMDLHTTASAMAAEAAAHEARQVMDEAETLVESIEPADETPADPEGESTSGEGEVNGEGLPEVDDEIELAPADDAESETEDDPEEEPSPRVIRRDARELKMLAEERERTNQSERIEIPPAYRADVSPLSGNGSLSVWLTHALETIGPQELSRIIAVHRSWGHLPPNLSRALAYVQEMLDETDDADPAWLRVMQELDELASL